MTATNTAPTAQDLHTLLTLLQAQGDERTNNEAIAARCLAARKEAKLSQDEVAALCGISKYKISDVERRRLLANGPHLAAIAPVLGVEVLWLLAGVTEANSPIKTECASRARMRVVQSDLTVRFLGVTYGPVSWALPGDELFVETDPKHPNCLLVSSAALHKSELLKQREVVDISDRVSKAIETGTSLAKFRSDGTAAEQAKQMTRQAFLAELSTFAANEAARAVHDMTYAKDAPAVIEADFQKAVTRTQALLEMALAAANA